MRTIMELRHLYGASATEFRLPNNFNLLYLDDLRHILWLSSNRDYFAIHHNICHQFNYPNVSIPESILYALGNDLLQLKNSGYTNDQIRSIISEMCQNGLLEAIASMSIQMHYCKQILNTPLQYGLDFADTIKILYSPFLKYIQRCDNLANLYTEMRAIDSIRENIQLRLDSDFASKIQSAWTQSNYDTGMGYAPIIIQPYNVQSASTHYDAPKFGQNILKYSLIASGTLGIITFLCTSSIPLAFIGFVASGIVLNCAFRLICRIKDFLDPTPQQVAF